MGKGTPGLNRPITHGDRTTIESQLARHQQHKAKEILHERRDLLDADPWENSLSNARQPQHNVMTDSIMSAEQFYSLDLTSSLSSSAVSGATDTSFSSTSTSSALPPPRGEGGAEPTPRRGTVHTRYLYEEDMIPFHDGVGLQQLSQTPPPQHPPPRVSKQPPPSSSSSPSFPSGFPSCKYSITLSGVTVALMEADPSHTYTTRLPGNGEASPPEYGGTPPSSLDEGGLDPVKYFDAVSYLLKDGINHQQLEMKQKELAQILPLDHLL